MNHVLLITSSLHGADGQSSQLAARYVDELRRAQPDLQITLRNLAAAPPPHLDAATFGAFATADSDRTPTQRAKTAWSDAAIAELQAADLVVMAAPMYNFGVPSVLKSWMDHVARAGVTFRYSENGPEGLLTGTRAVVISTRGGQYLGTPMDSHTPFVETFLGFLGIGPVEFVHAEGLAMGDDHAANALDHARHKLQRLAA